MAVGALMQPDLLIPVHENTDVAAARRLAAGAAVKAGFGEQEAGSIAVIVTEVATNLIKHAQGGEVVVRNVSKADSSRLEILAIDRGKGMSNPARCFEDGYSTAGSPGTGLGAIGRLSQTHEVYTLPGAGTVVFARTVSSRAGSVADSAADPVVGAISVPYPGEEVCGDAWAYTMLSARTRIMVADGLGHGLLAAEAARAAVSCLIGQPEGNLIDVLERAHSKLRSTRGAAVAVADVDFRARRVIFACVGNITGVIVSSAGVRRQLVSMNGTAGHGVSRFRQFEYPCEHGSLLILHSDGLSSNWAFEKYPGLLQRHPSVIAAVLFRDFRRTKDDATVVVIRGGLQ